MNDFLSNLGSLLKQLGQRIGEGAVWLAEWLGDNQASVGDWYIGLMRWVMPALALGILLSVLLDMLRVKNPKETWGFLNAPGWGKFPIHHWECIVGRAKHCDVRVNYPTVSRSQCALIRDAEGTWRVHNLSAKNKTAVNEESVGKARTLKAGDELSFGGVKMYFSPAGGLNTDLQTSDDENDGRTAKKNRPLARWRSLILLTFFQIAAATELTITRPDDAAAIFMCFGILIGIMWAYVLLNRAAGVSGFEPEIIAFFTCTLSLAVTASASASALLTQTCAIALGIVFFLILGWYLRDLNRVVKTRHLAAGAAILLLLVNLIFGSVHHGAMNWITIGSSLSVQPSELVKVCFIFAGAATLDRLFAKRNIWGFIALSGFCMGCLAVMSDFGTALIFFVTFLVIAFLRSGDFATLALICGGAAAAVGLILSFKPYIASRFAVWGHAWEYPNDAGFQQVRTMSASASGGLIGTGPGKGWLSGVFASDTDLVFGMLCEEWGLIIALLAVGGIVALSIFAVRVTRSGRSSYYTIAACAATSLLVFQTLLHVLGSVDMLPLTGVTFPFLSKGGSSMIACWGLLAFVKAADTRQNASFAVRTAEFSDEDAFLNALREDVPERTMPGEEYETDASAEPELRVFADGTAGTEEALTDFSQLEESSDSPTVDQWLNFSLDLPEERRDSLPSNEAEQESAFDRELESFFQSFEDAENEEEERR